MALFGGLGIGAAIAWIVKKLGIFGALGKGGWGWALAVWAFIKKFGLAIGGALAWLGGIISYVSRFAISKWLFYAAVLGLMIAVQNIIVWGLEEVMLAMGDAQSESIFSAVDWAGLDATVGSEYPNMPNWLCVVNTISPFSEGIAILVLFLQLAGIMLTVRIIRSLLPFWN